MILFCENCGERYVIEEEDIEGPEIVITCRVCSEVTEVTLPKAGERER